MTLPTRGACNELRACWRGLDNAYKKAYLNASLMHKSCKIYRPEYCAASIPMKTACNTCDCVHVTIGKSNMTDQSPRLPATPITSYEIQIDHWNLKLAQNVVFIGKSGKLGTVVAGFFGYFF